MNKNNSQAFTIIELLVVIAVIGLLAAILFPLVGRAKNAGRSAACCSNLRQMQAAFTMYLDDHNGRLFPWKENAVDGTLWYWGLESTSGGGEGSRTLDKSRARLAPYFSHVDGIEICPALPYHSSDFKQKFDCASYGYGLNIYLIDGTPQNKNAGVRKFDQITRPCDTIVWGDAAQVNNWQSPASPQNPMLEEWYYLSGATPPSFHFRHNRHFNAVMADGSIRTFKPTWLDSRCDGRVGYIEKPGQDYFLRPVK